MWTLEYNGEEKSLEAWGLANPVRHLVSQGKDSLTLAAPGLAVDAPALFPYGGIVRLLRDGVQFFLGRRIKNPRSGNYQGEGQLYTFVGPWWWLEESTYQQTWYQQVDPTSQEKSLVGGLTSHIILGQGFNGARISTATQIQDAVQYAIQRGAPIQMADDYPATNAPLDEGTDLPCSEVIKLMLRWVPDAVTWFDYSAQPPRLHIGRRGALQAKTLDINDGDFITDFALEPREDLQRPAVALKYERSVQVNGLTYLNVFKDIAPAGATGEEFGALVSTINLQGPASVIAEAAIECAPIGATSTDSNTRLGWWARKVPWLVEHGIQVKSITVAEQFTSQQFSSQNLNNELVDGQIADWMQFASENVTIQARVTYQAYQFVGPNLEVTGEKVNELISVNLVATNGQTGVYRSLQSLDTGDPVPVGLAAQLYEALGQVQYEGLVVTVEEELGAHVWLGRVLNFTGGLPQWATARALVQEVTEELETGTTTVSIGPAEPAGPQDLVELLKVNRSRFVYTAPSSQVSGEVSRSKVTLGRHAAKRDSTTGGGNVTRMRMYGTSREYIDINPETLGIDLHAPQSVAGAGGASALTIDGITASDNLGNTLDLTLSGAKGVIGPNGMEAKFRDHVLLTPDGAKTFRFLTPTE